MNSSGPTDEFGVPGRSNDTEDLCLAETSRRAAGTASALFVDARRVREVDLGTVEALARAALLARRHCRQLRITNAPPNLRALLDLVGLTEVVPCA
jgi:ABC-type transporter Mla MlaB component